MEILRKITVFLELVYAKLQITLGFLLSRHFLSGSGKLITLVPSLLSLSRIPLGYLLWTTESAWAQVLIHISAGLSDAYDGLLARRLNCTSRSGAVLDPLCDKIYVFWCAAAYWNKLDHFALAGIVAIEGLIMSAQITSLAIAWYKRIRLEEADLKATIWGKAKGAAECAALLAASLGLTKTAACMLLVAITLAIGSVVDYQVKRAARQRG